MPTNTTCAGANSAESRETTGARRAPWPHLLACATVHVPARAVTALSVHVPNGSTYKWKKIETLEALHRMLVGDRLIVGGDLNEPESLLPDGRMASFLAEEDGTTEGSWQGYPRSRWQRAVEIVLGHASPLRHAWLTLHPRRPETTHIVRGVDRFFDHVLVSDDFEVVDAGFEHEWRMGVNAPSDHSGATAVVR